jgi:hypothetical protein
MSRLRWPRIGLRREILILLPVTVFLLVLMAGFTLFAYRSAIDLLVEDRQREVVFLTRQIASELSAGPWPTAAELRRRAPAATRIAVTDRTGRAVTVGLFNRWLGMAGIAGRYFIRRSGRGVVDNSPDLCHLHGFTTSQVAGVNINLKVIDIRIRKRSSRDKRDIAKAAP